MNDFDSRQFAYESTTDLRTKSTNSLKKHDFFFFLQKNDSVVNWLESQ